MKNLTPKQQHIYDFIESSIERRHICPTLREVGKYCRVSVGTANDQVRALMGKGLLRRGKKGAARALSLVKTAQRGVPVVGRVGAGTGVIAQDDLEGYVELGDLASNTDFLLRIKGDSMDAAGILPGDFVQVHKQKNADDGDLVVALVGEEGVVKRFRNTSHTPRLESANKKYPPITEEFQVVGKVIGLIRRSRAAGLAL